MRRCNWLQVELEPGHITVLSHMVLLQLLTNPCGAFMKPDAGVISYVWTSFRHMVMQYKICLVKTCATDAVPGRANRERARKYYDFAGFELNLKPVTPSQRVISSFVQPLDVMSVLHFIGRRKKSLTVKV